MADTQFIKKTKAQLAFVQDCLAHPDRQLGGHVDRGPVEYARIRSQYIADGEKMAATLENRIETAEKERQARGTAAREAKQTVCPVCFCSHPGEC